MSGNKKNDARRVQRAQPPSTGGSSSRTRSQAIPIRGRPTQPSGVYSARTYGQINAAGNSHVVAGDYSYHNHSHYHFQAPMLSEYDFTPGAPIQDATLQMLVSYASSMSDILGRMTAERAESGAANREMQNPPTTDLGRRFEALNVDEQSSTSDFDEMYISDGRDSDLFDLDEEAIGHASSGSDESIVDELILETRRPSPVRSFQLPNDYSLQHPAVRAQPIIANMTKEKLRPMEDDPCIKSAGSQFHNLDPNQDYDESEILRIQNSYQSLQQCVKSWFTQGKPWHLSYDEQQTSQFPIRTLQLTFQLLETERNFMSDVTHDYEHLNAQYQSFREECFRSWIWDPKVHRIDATEVHSGNEEEEAGKLEMNDKSIDSYSSTSCMAIYEGFR